MPDRPRPGGASPLHPAAALTATLEPDVRIGPLQPVAVVLRELGHDPQSLLASVGLNVADFRNPDRRIPFATAGALLAACASATRVPHFGLLVGRRFELESMGPLVRLIRDADSVGGALRNVVRHLQLQDRGAVAFLFDAGHRQAALGYAVFRHDTPGIAQIYDIVLAIACGILRALCGPQWKPTAVFLAHFAPDDIAPYRRFFGAPVHFDVAHSEVHFDNRWLDRPLAGAHPERRIEAERVALTAERGNAVSERALRVVQRLILADTTTSTRVSGALGLHERELRRRLASEGTNLQAIVNTARFELARQWLRNTKLSLSEIASALHYSDATAFSRAFRSWAGTSPRAWRKAADLDTAQRVTPARTPASGAKSRS